MSKYSPNLNQFYHTIHKPDPRCTHLSTKDFYWLLAEAWDAAMISYLIREKNCSVSHWDAFPAYLRGSKHNPLHYLALWILVDKQRQPVAWVEGQMHSSALKTLYLHCGGLNAGTSFGAEALAHLISACFIQMGVDLVKVASPSRPWQTILDAFEIGERRQVLCPLREFGMHGLLTAATCEMTLYALAKGEWWQASFGQKHRQTLHYLTVRQERSRQAPKATQGFWARLGGKLGRSRTKKKAQPKNEG